MRSRKSLPRPEHGRTRRHRFHVSFERMESRQLLSIITVTTTNDDFGATPVPNVVTLRDAITMANALPGPDTIDFDLPTTQLFRFPGSNSGFPSGFDPTTQTWHLTLGGPLPAITDQVTIDG
jgi:hypothetical protein